MDGVLVVDKPQGPTSHDVVALARRALREKRIGHTGTLDPLASGVLPLVIGRATRLASFLSSAEKEYEADVRLGAETDTYDADGIVPGVPPPAAPPVDAAQVEAVLARFRGAFHQVPPPFSAKKVAGVPAYKLARRQQPVELAAVPVLVERLDLLALDAGVAKLRMVTSSGFYVRSLAHDVGRALGCGAYLEALRRTRAEPFGLERSVTLDVLQGDADAVATRVIPLEDLLPAMPAVRVTARGAQRASHGNFLSPEDLAERGTDPVSGAAGPGTGPGPLGPGARVRVLGEDGRLLAIAEAGADGLLRPSIVLV